MTFESFALGAARPLIQRSAGRSTNLRKQYAKPTTAKIVKRMAAFVPIPARKSTPISANPTI
jgi:hypothetical protein